MNQQPEEVRALQDLHSAMYIAAHSALESAIEATRIASHEKLESLYWSTLAYELRNHVHNELATVLGEEIRWHNDRGFLAMVPGGSGIAIRFGRCDRHGRPNDPRERKEGSPYRRFQEGEKLLFEDAGLTPIFAGYSLNRRGVAQGNVEVDRVILAKYVKREHAWSWALDPANQGEIPSVVEAEYHDLQITPVEIELPQQRGFAQ